MDGLQLNLKVNQFWICMRISLERSILIAERFLQELIKKYGKNPVYTDDDGGGTWYGIHKHVDF
jgi:transposase-like protein